MRDILVYSLINADKSVKFCRLDDEFYRILKVGSMRQVKVDPSQPDDKAKYQWVEPGQAAADNNIMMFNADASLMYNVQRKFVYTVQ